MLKTDTILILKRFQVVNGFKWQEIVCSFELFSGETFMWLNEVFQFRPFFTLTTLGGEKSSKLLISSK